MDERKAYGVLAALGNSIGAAAKADASVLAALRAVADAAALEAFLLAHRGSLPEALVREFARSVTPATLAGTRAKLVLQAKMVATGGAPVSPEDAAKGPVKHR